MDISGAAVASVASVAEKKSERVRRMIQEVEAALAQENAAQVSSQFADYQKEFPRIFEMLLTRTYPRDVMEMMIGQLEKMEAGNVSQHNASVHVGGVLVDRFVKPQLKHAPPKSS